LRVAVYAIALNEAKHIERFLRSCSGADVVVVADTGSGDGTPELLRQGGAQVFSISVRPWRFDDARNASLALVPADVDVCVALDLDEVLCPGWRAALESAWTPRTTLGRYRYVTAHLPNREPAVEVSGAKIHARSGYRWRRLCHEHVVPDRLVEPVETWLPGVRVDHWPDLSKSRRGYLDLLEAAVAEPTHDARDLFLLGREYVALSRWSEAETMLRRYLKMAGQHWPRQRAVAWRRLGRCRNEAGDYPGALNCFEEAVRLAADMRDIWFDLADVHASRGVWDECLKAARTGIALPRLRGHIGNEFMHSGARPYYRASLAALHLGQVKEARGLAAEAVKREPARPLYREHMESLDKAEGAGAATSRIR
jgi:tetratricopeptide (TPR) repeat protein